MEKFEVLEHKADLKIRVFGRNKEELFQNALLGMIAGLRPERKTQSVKRKTRIEAFDLPALLVDFLSEVLYLIQVNKEIYNKVKFKRLTDKELEVELYGWKVEGFGEDIKAVTHHDLNVAKNENGVWEAVILFDI